MLKHKFTACSCLQRNKHSIHDPPWRGYPLHWNAKTNFKQMAGRSKQPVMGPLMSLDPIFQTIQAEALETKISSLSLFNHLSANLQISLLHYSRYSRLEAFENIALSDSLGFKKSKCQTKLP